VGDSISVDSRDPDLWFNLYINKNGAVIKPETSGGSPHKRGCWERSVEVTMIEILVADSLVCGFSNTLNCGNVI